MTQKDEVFMGVISNLETQISSNSKMIRFHIFTHSKDKVYQATIQYDKDDSTLQQVQKTFKNFALLFEYINQYSEDPERVKIDLKRSEIKIVKNHGLRKMKNAPILLIPLSRKTQLQTRKPSYIQNQVHKQLNLHKILVVKFREAKFQRQLLMRSLYNLQNDVDALCSHNGIQIKQRNGLDINKKFKVEIQDKQAQNNMEQMLRQCYSQADQRVSLFFESDNLNTGQRACQQVKKQYSQQNELQMSEISEQNPFTVNPFSYLD